MKAGAFVLGLHLDEGKMDKAVLLLSLALIGCSSPNFGQDAAVTPAVTPLCLLGCTVITDKGGKVRSDSLQTLTTSRTSTDTVDQSQGVK